MYMLLERPPAKSGAFRCREITKYSATTREGDVFDLFPETPEGLFAMFERRMCVQELDLRSDGDCGGVVALTRVTPSEVGELALVYEVVPFPAGQYYSRDGKRLLLLANGAPECGLAQWTAELPYEHVLPPLPYYVDAARQTFWLSDGARRQGVTAEKLVIVPPTGLKLTDDEFRKLSMAQRDNLLRQRGQLTAYLLPSQYQLLVPLKTDKASDFIVDGIAKDLWRLYRTDYTAALLLDMYTSWLRAAIIAGLQQLKPRTARLLPPDACTLRQ